MFNDIMNNKIVLIIMGVLVGLIVPKLLNILNLTSKIKLFLNYLKKSSLEFLKHCISFIGVFIVLIIFYYIFNKFNYGEDMLPNLYATGISIFFIDFLIKMRDKANKKNVCKLLDERISKIQKEIHRVIINVANIQGDISILNSDIIKSNIKRTDLINDTIDILKINSEGQIEKINANRIDLLYYFRQDTKSIIDDILSHFLSYLNFSQISFLSGVDNLLDKNFFKTKISSTKLQYTDQEYHEVEDKIIDYLIQINNINNKSREV